MHNALRALGPRPRARSTTACLVWAAAWLALTLAPAPAEAVRKCVDGEGRMLFTDLTCPAGTKDAGELDQPIQRTRSGKPAEPARHPRAPGPAPERPPAAPEAHPRKPEGTPPAVPMMAKAIAGARLTKALADLSNLKTYSLVHYAEQGAWPSGPGDLGLDPASFHTDEIREIGYRRDGGIVAYLADAFGHGKWVWLQPRETLGGANLTWDCRTNVPRVGILGLGAACEFEAPAGAGAAAQATENLKR